LVTEGWDPSAIDLGAYSLGKPHNTYLVILNEIGLVGSALLAIMFVFAILLPMSRSRGASFYGVLAALVGIMNTETSLLAPKTGYAFALMIWHGTLRRKNNQQRNCVARKPW